MLDSAIRQVDTVRNTLKKATGKTTTIGRRLRGVEALSTPDAQALLGSDTGAGSEETDEDEMPAGPA
jgi:DNA recombination protein RmuC